MVATDLECAPGSGRPNVNNKTFEIVVKGRLSPALVGAIEGFEVSRFEGGRTYLVGTVPDQARLHSLIDVIGSLNIELVSVNPLPEHQSH